jgi:hypothetical protein
VAQTIAAALGGEGLRRLEALPDTGNATETSHAVDEETSRYISQPFR